MRVHNISGVIIRRDDQILMVKEKPNRNSKTPFWMLPAGGVDKSENYLEGAIREAKEETGLDLIGEGKFVYHCEYKNKYKGYRCSVKMYEFFEFEGDINPQDPDNCIEEARFFHVDEVIKKLESLDWPVVKEPATTYLRDNAEINLKWSYEADNKGNYSLIERCAYES